MSTDFADVTASVADVVIHRLHITAGTVAWLPYGACMPVHAVALALQAASSTPGVGRAVMEVLGAVVIAVLSGSAGATLTNRANRKQQQARDVRTDVDVSITALAALRDAYRRCKHLLADAPDQVALSSLEDRLNLAAIRTSEVIVEAAREYIAVGQLYAVRDPDNGEGAEQAAYEALASALVAERKAYG